MTTYDPIIRQAVLQHFPELLECFGPHGWLWIKAQIWQESRFDPQAVSPAGAMGLMQLMPGTDRWIDGDLDGFDPVGNIDNGVRYLAEQWHKLSEINLNGSRLRFALASYNAGRGYINCALALARQHDRLPYGYRGWLKAGSPSGRWQSWPWSKKFLADDRCKVRGLRPDHTQIFHYVAAICDKTGRYFNEVACQPIKTPGAAAPTA